MIRSGPVEIAREPMRLREITRGDTDDLYRWRMGPDARAAFVHSDPVPFEVHEAFLASYFSAGNDDRWFVVEVEGEAVGTLALYAFSDDGRTAEWGRFVIDPEHRGHGWGAAALDLLLGHAVDLGVERLRCNVLAGNAVAERTYERFGFREVDRFEHEGRQFRKLVADLGRSQP